MSLVFLNPLQDIRKINGKCSVIDIDGYRLIQSVDLRIYLTLKKIDQQSLLIRVKDPVFPHAGFQLFVQLFDAVLASGGG